MWIDLGCEDFRAARRNREMVKHKRKISGYLYYELRLRGLSLGQTLPKDIPQGELMKVSKKEYREYFGNSLHEIGFFENYPRWKAV